MLTPRCQPYVHAGLSRVKLCFTSGDRLHRAIEAGTAETTASSMATIYRKTAKGHSEIETRALRLSPRLRSALILIDGRRSDDDVHKLIASQPEETLRLLSEQGFIEIIAITQDAPSGRQGAPAPAAAAAFTSPRLPASASADAASAASSAPANATPARSFETTRSQAVRLFTDLVGPMAEALAIKMERTRSADELRPLVQTAQTIIGNARGGQAAADYAAKVLGSPGG